ncbi:porin family protein [Hyunsoonleella ulvae]|uniref:hypothetical protein n=1 Tax=Hyunsoonleella ulvae TaxID=2799948 RepID=UPI0019398449|nr:hypothetical protein [Hyunsoonleella ulvae]
MKRHTLTVCLLFLVSATTFAQDFNLSATAGYLNINSIFKVDGEKRDLDFKSSGFYIGAQSEIELAEKVNLLPELLLAINSEGNVLYLGPIAAYEVTEAFSALFGPTFTYLLEDVARNYQKFGISLAVGGSYNFTEKIYAQAKYNIQVNDYYTGDSDISSKANYLLIGVGFRIL